MTLKQIITRLEQIALSHKQINHFFIGDKEKFLLSSDVVYPAVFCELKDNGSISRADKQVKYNFTFYFFDLLNVSISSNSNEWEIKSDLSSIAQDFIALLNYTGYQDEWQISNNNSTTFATYEMQDLCAGVSVDVEIAIPYNADRCKVPQTGLPEPSEDTGEIIKVNMNLVKNYTYVGTGAEGTTVTFGTLSYKSVLMVFKGLPPLKSTTGTPTVDEYKFTAASGRFDFGNGIEAGQIIQILYR